MTEGIIDKVVIPSYTFMNQINDNLATNIADIILDYYQQELKRLKQELKTEIRGIEYTVPNKWRLMEKIIGNGEK